MALEAVEPAMIVSSTAEYTCPMHPEVVRNGPGSCPICGMALEPRNAPSENHAELDEYDAPPKNQCGISRASICHGDGV